ncbi:alpha-amylase family glycosyl hydrolase [Sphingomicrobium lutaoense]|uniref:Glycosidase n=1 Tax=Sphingomicrobium lutaoense TaxID=515949 RepID=A0A839YXW2_9SPHN|nr:alpha-amylase family glycosyl hydrolase [Sphingomicrobium lutaoense]MBB3763148.1 glycosidase [Sphingomicrobium lutaoense]
MKKWSLFAAAASLAAIPAMAQDAQDYRARPASDEVVYFVLPDRFDNGDPTNDRGGIKGDRLAHGYDPTHKGFYHGGDLAGLTGKLDYLEAMGITAIWFAPIFKNKPVQGPAGDESAGYHGYWVTDFTSVDPHFGTNDEFKAFVDAAHARGMKVYMDIITNHTADVIRYKDGDYSYRSKADYPYSTRGGVNGEPINEGFAGDEVQTLENFARLTDPNYAYEVHVPEAEKYVKKPAWLNDPIYYHNRGDTRFFGEDSLYGDFVGLDDLFTEHPLVVGGMIEIYGDWIERFGIDGFRIDTARHVNPEFWQQFIPAMKARADAAGIPHFHMFGEIFRDDSNNGYIAQYTRRDRLPSVLDFAFQMAVRETVVEGKGTHVLANLFAGDVLYEGGEETALSLPTFLGNHDMGRFAHFVRAKRPDEDPSEALARVTLAHAMLMTLRGSPVIYSGSEQGFVGDGGDQLAREDMFPSKVDVYNDNMLLGTDATTAEANFDQSHPLYQEIAMLAAMRADNAALRRGRQVTRAYEEEPGLFAASRFDPDSGKETLLLFNTSDQPISGQVLVSTASTEFTTLAGQCSPEVSAPGSLSYALAPFAYAVCAAR